MLTLIKILMIIGLISIPASAEAHKRHKNIQPDVNISTVTINWVWVPASLRHSAHWYHPHHGQSHRPASSPPPDRLHHDVWVSGHWQGRGRGRHWVRGFWTSCRHRK